MPDWLVKLLEQWAAVTAAPIPFAIAVVIVGAVIWFALSWSYGSIISRQAAETKLLERQMTEATARPKQGPLENKTEFRLQIYADDRQPDRIAPAIDIWRWYYLRDVLVLLNQDGSKKSELITSKLFISFDQPMSVGTLEVRSDKPLPRHEVKEFNNRFSIVVFAEPLPENNLEIVLRP